MNLVGTLAKVAMGVMVARGVGKMMGGKGGSSAGGLGGLLGGAQRGASQQDQSGNFGGIGGSDGVGGLGGNASSSPASSSSNGGLGGLLGGLAKGQGSQGGLGGLFGELAKRAGTQQAGGAGGLGGLLGSVLGGSGASGGGLGGLLEGLGGKSAASGACDGSHSAPSSGSLGDLFNQAMNGQAPAQVAPDQNAQAELMLRGMINAAKSDGQFDQDEQQRILKHLGDVEQSELEFVRNEMAKPLDVEGFIASIPKGMEQQVYLMSLLGIQLDSQAEAQYLDTLARGLGISHEVANAIHQQVGVPVMYS